MSGQIFRQVYISRSQVLDCTVTQPNFCLSGEGDDVLAFSARCASR